MTDESAEPQPIAEAATPGRSLRGAAEDLSSLFGEEALDPGRGATALGPQREAALPADTSRLGPAIQGLTQRISFLEKEMREAVGHIQAVDRHLASTYQVLQGLVERLPEDGGFASGHESAPVDLRPVIVRLESIEISLTTAVERLRSLETQVRAVQSAPPADGADMADAVAALRSTIAELRTQFRSDLRAELAASQRVPPPAIVADIPDPVIDPETHDIDALLASAPAGPSVEASSFDVGEPGDPQDPAALYWPSTGETGKADGVPPGPEIEPEPISDPGPDPMGGADSEESPPDAARRGEAVSFDRPPTPQTENGARTADDEESGDRADARPPFWSAPNDSSS